MNTKDYIHNMLNHNLCPIIVEKRNNQVGGFIDRVDENGNYHILPWKLTPFSTKQAKAQTVTLETLLSNFIIKGV